jgi:hypothetical protein
MRKLYLNKKGAIQRPTLQFLQLQFTKRIYPMALVKCLMTANCLSSFQTIIEGSLAPAVHVTRFKQFIFLLDFEFDMKDLLII